ncbi:MAG: IS630 family transposase, partial [Anaerolineae bacterium]|nr:IS630 family transposase [Anaerolineae bacterium]
MGVAQDAPNTLFLAEDEASLYLQATTSHVWSPVGQTPIVRVDPGRKNTHFYGTLNLQTGEEIAMQSDDMNSEASARHLEMILDANPDVPILLFWDRAPWHRGKAVDQVIEKNPRLEIMRFPPGCPELNPQEHVWKAVRNAVSHNHIETKLSELCCLSAKWKNGIHVIVHKRSQNHEKKAQALQSGRKSSFT